MPTQATQIKEAYHTLARLIQNSQYTPAQIVSYAAYHSSAHCIDGGDELLENLRKSLKLSFHYHSWIYKLISFVVETHEKSVNGKHPFNGHKVSESHPKWDSLMQRRVNQAEKQFGLKTHEWQSEYAAHLKRIGSESGEPVRWLNREFYFFPELFGHEKYTADEEYWGATVRWLQDLSEVDNKRHEDESLDGGRLADGKAFRQFENDWNEVYG